MSPPTLPPACSTSGPNLRRLYLPGLEGLKAELRKLDFLLERYLPALTAHLNVRRGQACAAPGQLAATWPCSSIASRGKQPLGAPTHILLAAFPSARIQPVTPPPLLPPTLQAAGVVPVLFASQWLLTCFSCPFPVGFACRLVDVMLQARGG